MNTWEAHAKGGPNRESFEICVIRKGYQHGHLSYGWFGDQKLLISHNGGPCRWGVSQLIWDRLLKVAEEVADKMNSKERSTFLNEPVESLKEAYDRFEATGGFDPAIMDETVRIWEERDK